jgi:hypothetical protein
VAVLLLADNGEARERCEGQALLFLSPGFDFFEMPGFLDSFFVL